MFKNQNLVWNYCLPSTNIVTHMFTNMLYIYIYIYKSSSKESDELFDSRILNNSSWSLLSIFNMLNLFFNLPGF